MACGEQARGDDKDATLLAEDLRRHLSDEPVLAGPPSRMYRFRKFARRNRAGLAVGVAIAASVVAGLVIAVLALGREREARAEADRSRRGEAKRRLRRHIGWRPMGFWMERPPGR